jgi:predicted CoA-substrate-specific enzyme activase
LVGLDVGSTTVKAVVIDPATDAILWQDYQRHETRQPEKVLEFLRCIQADLSAADDRLRIFITGSGSGALAPHLGARQVQEVNAVALAVEHFHPDAGSVIELGGQDAKIIIWVEDPQTGMKRKLPSMNDKCAGGTGAVIDKINAKLRLDGETLQALRYQDVKLHPVAGKCGVFAETDINGLQKQGVPSHELMASLFEAIVQQNLSVLTRGHTLRPKVLLLGGPNTFIPALQEAWRHNIPPIWEERKFPLPEGADPQELIFVPEHAQYYAAIGAVLYGKGEEAAVGRFRGTAALEEFVETGRRKMREATGAPGLAPDADELEAFRRRYALPPFDPARFQAGETVEAYLGIDGGSTSTKAVLLDREGRVLAKAYRLSAGNPLEDTQAILKDLRRQVEGQGAALAILGVGTTGYAKDMLREVLNADVALVETVAHTQSALKYYPEAEVIVDVGGQDIKVVLLRHGKVKDFRLNTQCSAGNGYFLQSTAQKFGYGVKEYADAAFRATHLPLFSYGCAVFMESDIVNFQQLGWRPEEIMSGLAHVLPKNIWLYVVQEPNLSRFGRTFILQGGTQHNLAAVKAQHDFIRSRVPDAVIRVHEHTGESGAIGVALEVRRVVRPGTSRFIGLGEAEELNFTATRDESTRCYFCKNHCLRTFIDAQTPAGEQRRFIIATCEKGATEAIDQVKVIKARLDAVKKASPNFAELAGKEAFRSYRDSVQSSVVSRQQTPSVRWWHRFKSNISDKGHQQFDRRSAVIGIPRVLNLYSTAPFFTAYLEALGVPFERIQFSPTTDETLYKEGSRRGSIDQCFPSKVAISHLHHLLYKSKRRPEVIFFPILINLHSDMVDVQAHSSCPTVAATPEVVKAAFTKEGDGFADHGIRYLNPPLNMDEPHFFSKQMLECWGPVLGVEPAEHEAAMAAGWQALETFTKSLRRRAREALDRLEAEGKVGVVLLGRPYHNDPGLNHEIVEEIQKLGYPIFTQDTLPTDPDILERLFGEEVRCGAISHPMSVADVWKNAYSENSNRKIWAAKYVARHPNLVALDLSSFKCGHDAPIYSVVEGIVEASETPYFTFHDIDENKPTGSIKIRVETIGYFLKRYEEDLRSRREREETLRRGVAAFEASLRQSLGPTGVVEPVTACSLREV